MKKVSKYLLLLLLVFKCDVESKKSKRSSNVPEDIMPSAEGQYSHGDTWQYIGYFKKKDNMIWAVLSQATSRYDQMNFDGVWDAGWQPKGRTNYFIQWQYPHEPRRCSMAYNTIYDSMVFCFFSFSLSPVTNDLFAFYKKTIVKCEGTDFRQLYIPGKRINKLHKFMKRIKSFKIVDFFILTKCLTSLEDNLTPQQFRTFYKLLDQILSKSRINQYGRYYLKRKFLSIFNNFNRDIVLKSSNLKVMSFHPFKSDIIGFGLNKLAKNGTAKLFEIHKKDKIKKLNVNNVEVAAYLPNDFLKKTKKNKELLVKFLFETKTSKNFHNIIGHYSALVVEMPGYCKKNNLTALNIYVDTKKGKWFNYGADYFDKVNYRCAFSSLHFIALGEKAKYVYRTAECEVHIDWLTPTYGSRILPKHTCLDGDLNAVQHDYCRKLSKTDRPWCGHATMSKRSDYLYQCYLNCTLNGVYPQCKNIPSKPGDYTTLFDINLYHLIQECTQTFTVNTLFKMFNRAIDLFKNEKKLTFSLLRSVVSKFRNALYSHYLDLPEIKIMPNVIFVHLTPGSNGSYGFVLRKSKSKSFKKGDVQLLMLNNMTRNFTAKKDVEMVFHLEKRGTYFSKPDIYIFQDIPFFNNKSIAVGKILWLYDKAVVNPYDPNPIVERGKYYIRSDRFKDNSKWHMLNIEIYHEEIVFFEKDSRNNITLFQKDFCCSEY